MNNGDLAGATIVFDLDGTLVDTAPDLLRALNHVLDGEGLPHPPMDQVRFFIGQGARRLIERAAELEGAHYPGEKLDDLTRAFVDIYAADIARESALFPGTLPALDALSEAGATLAVCTNKRTGLSVQLLDALNLTSRFAAIVGADSVPEKKPHADHYRTTVARAGGEIGRSVMIGDTAIDSGAARAAGAPVILVEFGYCAADELAALKGDAIISHYSELPAACRRLLLP